MTTFYDALSGEKRQFNHRVRSPAPEPYYIICQGHLRFEWHRWADESDDQCKCSRCGVSVLFIRVVQNNRKKTQCKS